MKYKISPSILSSDFSNLGREIKDVESHADILHLDVMDGHFVDNISYGIPVIKHIKTKLPMDCHLMISNPLKYAESFAKYADRLFFHPNTVENIGEVIKSIKEKNIKIGIALNPDEPVSLIDHLLEDIDGILILSVYAGFGGQKFMPEVLKKIEKLRNELGYEKDILIDGGINEETIKEAKEAGANIFVAGSSIFGKKNRKRTIKKMKRRLGEE